MGGAASALDAFLVRHAAGPATHCDTLSAREALESLTRAHNPSPEAERRAMNVDVHGRRIPVRIYQSNKNDTATRISAGKIVDEGGGCECFE